MSLWAEVKRSSAKPAGGPSAVPMREMKAHNNDPSAGKALIVETLNRITDAWSEIETCGGSLAWEWILRGSYHGALIRQTEAEVDRIGSEGDPGAFRAACESWLSEWREGIEDWKKANGRTGAEQGSFNPEQPDASFQRRN